MVYIYASSEFLKLFYLIKSEKINIAVWYKSKTIADRPFNFLVLF